MEVFISLNHQYTFFGPLFLNLQESGPESYHPWPAGVDHVLLSDSNPSGPQSETDPCAHSACLSNEKSKPRKLYRRKGHYL